MEFLVYGIVFLLCGAALLLKPKLLFDLTESWKSYRSDEPSQLYLFSTRFGGVILSVIGVASLIVFFMN